MDIRGRIPANLLFLLAVEVSPRNIKIKHIKLSVNTKNFYLSSLK